MIRLTSLYADLDIKPEACPDLGTAVDIIDGVSAYLGERPCAVTDSGHGLHPYWPIDFESASALTNREAKHLIAQFGRLVKAVAAHHGCQVDSVFDLARVLRVPDTVNYKAAPVPVRCVPDTGKPLTVKEIRTALDEFGITEEHPRGSRAAGTSQGPFRDEYCSRACLINRVAKAPGGRRNTTLFGAAMDAAKQGDLDDDMVQDLQDAADECGLARDDGPESVRNTIESAARKAEEEGYVPDGNPFTKARTSASFRSSASQGERVADDEDDNSGPILLR